MKTNDPTSQPFAGAPSPNGNKIVSNDDDDDDGYAPSSLLSFPPLARLQAYGLCCAFLETETGHDARIGVQHLHHYPITWYRKKLLVDVANDVKSAVPHAGGFVDGLGQMFGTHGKNARVPMSFHPVPATLTVADSDTHGPTVEVRTLEMHASTGAASEAVSDYITSGKPWWEDPALRDQPPTRTIPLYLVDRVAAASWSMAHDTKAGGVRLYAAPPATKAKGLLMGMAPSGQEILRFDTLGGGGDEVWGNAANVVTEPNKHSDRVIVQLKSLVDWNRRRIARDITRGRMLVAPKSNSSGYVVMD